VVVFSGINDIGPVMRAAGNGIELVPMRRESRPSPFVFFSERGSLFTTVGFARMVEATSSGIDDKGLWTAMARSRQPAPRAQSMKTMWSVADEW
jgi:hypothetical protein